MKMGPLADWRGFFADIVKLGGEEFLGEGTSSAITKLTDYLALGDKSSYEARKRQYQEEKQLSREAAAKAAFLDEVEEVLFDAFGGFASGSISASAAVGGETAKQYVQKTAKVTDAESYARRLQEVMPGFGAENGDATKLQAKDEDNGGATEINVVKNQNNGKIKMGNVDVRKWYKENISKIYDAIDKSLSVEEQAKQAFEARNRLRSEARNMMEDEKARNRLDIERPNKSFEELIESKMKRKGMTREEAIYDILITAKKSNENVDKELGLGDE